ncbi:LytR/AlgR family response regulator transcription factor [Pedobacter sp.]
MKISCLIIDDEPYAIEFMKRLVERTPELELAGTYIDPLDALHKLIAKELVVDLIFLDIEMPQLNGLDFAAQAGHLAYIVLVTGDNRLALQAYELGVVDYLVKPVLFTRFTQSVNRVKALMLPAQPLQLPEGKKIGVRHGLNNTITYVELRDITHVEASSHYCVVFTDHLPSIRTHVRLSDMEKLLGRGFMRVHRSFIINFSKITKFYGNTIVLNMDREVPLGKSYREDFLKLIERGGPL